MQALAVVRQKGVEVYQGINPGRNNIGDAGNDHAAIRVPDQDDVTKTFPVREIDDVVDMRLQRYGVAVEVRALSESRQRRGEDRVTGSAQKVGEFSIAPPTVPRPMHEYECWTLRVWMAHQAF